MYLLSPFTDLRETQLSFRSPGGPISTRLSEGLGVEVCSISTHTYSEWFQKLVLSGSVWGCWVTKSILEFPILVVRFQSRLFYVTFKTLTRLVTHGFFSSIHVAYPNARRGWMSIGYAVRLSFSWRNIRSLPTPFSFSLCRARHGGIGSVKSDSRWMKLTSLRDRAERAAPCPCSSPHSRALCYQTQ